MSIEPSPSSTSSAKQRIGALILPIAITSGAAGSYARGIERVPKKDLMSNAGYILMSQSLSGEPRMAGLKELRAVMEAFLSFAHIVDGGAIAR